MKKLHFITIVLFLSALNTFGNDYLWVSGSFDRGEFKFGYFLQLLQLIKEYFPFSYTYVHIFFLSLIAYSIVKLKKASVLVCLIVLYPFGELLNEQIRFFSAFLITLVSPWNIILSVLIHPAGGLLSFGYYAYKVFHPFFIKKRVNFYILMISSFIMSLFISQLALIISSNLGYGYAGTVFFETASIESYFVKAFIWAFFLIFIKLNKHDVLLYLLILTTLFSELSIVSGRSLIVFLILAPLLIIEPSQRTKTVYDRYSFVFGTIILLVSYYRFF